jgi:HAD superfamily hydrolase (TIGR01484 family)
MNKLAVFDFDGTIAQDMIVSNSTLLAIKSMQAKGWTTTISTGRCYASIRHRLGDYFEQIISDGAPIMLSHGSKISTKKGETLFIADLSAEELHHVVDFIRANIEILGLIWYDLDNAEKEHKFFCRDTATYADNLSRSGYATVWEGNLTQLLNDLLTAPVSTVGVRIAEYLKVENFMLNFTRTPIRVLFQDGNMDFIKSNINKSLAISKMMDILNVQPDELLVAGNAVNDIEMLNISAKYRILVGEGVLSDNIFEQLYNKNEVLRVKSPDDIASTLQEIL